MTNNAATEQTVGTEVKAGSIKKVAVRVNGVSDLDVNQEIKGMLQQIVWVMEIEEKRMGEFVVGYPENSLYLANSLRQEGRFIIVGFTPYSLTLEWKKIIDERRDQEPDEAQGTAQEVIPSIPSRKAITFAPRTRWL